ncbi:helix-turn-helix domain-containing protein [Nocardia sp. BSTN01]|uniref:helix-turn-helix domain-containing protein n=1 Tax=Nocardia sp. BSTN01 TaxID=2783665 RepID=UPI00188E40A7|nr:helix-turn-helix domain-containing protein [Nocardia sp. BSTN01]
MTTRAEEALKRVTSEPTVSVDDAAVLLGVGRSTVYAAVKLQELPSIRVRQRLRIPSSWLRQVLDLADRAATNPGTEAGRLGD